MTKKMSKKLVKELEEVLRTTDYTTFQIHVGYDSEENIVIIPKPLLALTLVDKSMTMKIMNSSMGKSI